MVDEKPLSLAESIRRKIEESSCRSRSMVWTNVTIQAMLSRARELSAFASETEYGELCDFGLAADGRCYLVFSKSSPAQVDTRGLANLLLIAFEKRLVGLQIVAGLSKLPSDEIN